MCGMVKEDMHHNHLGYFFKYVCRKLIHSMQGLHDKWEWRVTKELIFKMTDLEFNYYATLKKIMVQCT